MQLHHYTGLGRSIVWSEKTNRWLVYSLGLIFLLSLLVLYLRFGLLPGLQMLKEAAHISILSFLCWALARELGPDAPLQAFLSLALGFLGAFLFPGAELLLLVLLLFCLRMLTRSTGQDLLPLDFIVLLLLAAYFLWKAMYAAPLVLALAFWLNSLMPRASMLGRYLAILLLLLSLSLYLLHNPYEAMPLDLPNGLTIFIIALATAFALYIRYTRQVPQLRSVGDYDGQPLQVKRLRNAQLFALLFAVIYSLWRGLNGFEALWPLWAAMLGLSLGMLIEAFQPKKKTL